MSSNITVIDVKTDEDNKPPNEIEPQTENIEPPKGNIEILESKIENLETSKPQKTKRNKKKEQELEIIPETKPETKPKRTKKQKVEEVIPMKEEVKPAKTIAKIICPDCNKSVSEKTFKYSHQPNCKAKKQPVVIDVAKPVVQEKIAVDFDRNITNYTRERPLTRQELIYEKRKRDDLIRKSKMKYLLSHAF